MKEVKIIFSFLALSPLRARTLSMPKKFKSIKAFSVSSRVKPPQIICGTVSMLYLCITAAQMATVPGLFFVATLTKEPSLRFFST